VDLLDTGSAAFAGFFGIGGTLDPTNPTDAFGGLGELGRWGFRRFRNRIKSFRRARKGWARKALRKASGRHRKLMGAAKNLVRRARNIRNPFQRGKMLKKAKAAAGAAAKTKGMAKQLAKEAVAPKLSRAEARVAMRPVVKQMAKSVARPAKGVMKRMAQIKRVPGGQQMLARAARTGELQKRIKTAMEKKVAQSVSKVPGAKLMPKATPKRKWWQRVFRPRRKRRWGLFGLGEEPSILDEAIAAEMDVQQAGMGQFLVPQGGEVELPVVAGLGEGTSSYMTLGDMDTVTQPTDTLDITKDWATDDIFGEPLQVGG
jgi:hypothetical protein